MFFCRPRKKPGRVKNMSENAKILVVDDEEVVRLSIRKALKKENYSNRKERSGFYGYLK